MKRPSWVHAFLILILICTLQPAVVAGESPGAARVLRVKAVADEAFRDNKNWEEEIRQHFKWADEKFRMFAGVGLELVAIERWTTHESKSMALLLNELRVKVDKGDADIVVGFTGHKAPKVLRLGYRGGVDLIRLPHIAGIAIALGDRAVVRRDDRFKKLTRHTLLHEIAHLFGGLHVKEKSILYTTSKRMDFALDPFNQRVFELTRQRETKQARQLIKELLERPFLPAVVFRDIAEIFFRDGDTKLAWKSLGLAKKGGLNVTALEQEILAGAPRPRRVKTSVLIEQAKAYYAKERYDPARSLLEQARTQEPRKEEIHYWLGRVARAERKHDEAARHQQRAIELNKKYPLPHLQLGRLAYDRKDYAAVISYLNRYVELAQYPASQAFFLLGKSRYQQNDFAAAEEDLKKAIQRNSGYGDAFYVLAAVYDSQGRREEAMAELKLAIDSRSLSSAYRSATHYNLAVLCCQTGQYEQAWEHARIAQELGYTDMSWLLAELAKVAPEPSGADEQRPSQDWEPRRRDFSPALMLPL